MSLRASTRKPGISKEKGEGTSLDFPDVLIVAHMRHEGVQTVISFDTDFDRFPDITRKEPEETEKSAA